MCRVEKKSFQNPFLNVNFLDISRRETMFLMMLTSLMGSLGRLSGASLGEEIIWIHILEKGRCVNIPGR
jgi:hypothetical protein